MSQWSTATRLHFFGLAFAKVKSYRDGLMGETRTMIDEPNDYMGRQ